MALRTKKKIKQLSPTKVSKKLTKKLQSAMKTPKKKPTARGRAARKAVKGALSTVVRNSPAGLLGRGAKAIKRAVTK